MLAFVADFDHRNQPVPQRASSLLCLWMDIKLVVPCECTRDARTRPNAAAGRGWQGACGRIRGLVGAHRCRRGGSITADSSPSVGFPVQDLGHFSEQSSIISITAPFAASRLLRLVSFTVIPTVARFEGSKPEPDCSAKTSGKG